MDDLCYFAPEDYEAAAENGIRYEVAYQRFYILGWSKERTIQTPLRKAYGGKKPAHPVDWEKYRKQCERIGIGFRAFQKRIQKGMTPEQAATSPKYSKKVSS